MKKIINLGDVTHNNNKKSLCFNYSFESRNAYPYLLFICQSTWFLGFFSFPEMEM